MSTVSRWWVDRSDPQRFDLYTRGSLYVMVAAEPLAAEYIVVQSDQAVGLAVVSFLAMSLAHAVLVGLVLHGGTSWFLGARRWPWPASAAVVAGCVAGFATSVWAFWPPSADAPPDGPGAAGMGLLMYTGFTVVAFTPRLRAAALVPAVLAGGLLVGGAVLALDWPVRNAVAVTMATLLALSCGCVAFRCSVWMLGVVWELDRSRRTQAQLAVAEERLRFARDLHDVLGRNLSVVALKSELAAALARRGQDEAVTEMLEVRDVAQESLREVRDVVRGYRGADLAAELAGARSVLRAAGINARVIGDGDDVPAGVQSVLGWVAREGTTNVLRHSTARTCTIRLDTPDPRDGTDSGTVVLSMENDGVVAAVGAHDGSGLSGLDERLRRMGGALTVESLDGERFRLTARVPRCITDEEER